MSKIDLRIVIQRHPDSDPANANAYGPSNKITTHKSIVDLRIVIHGAWLEIARFLASRRNRFFDWYVCAHG